MYMKTHLCLVLLLAAYGANVHAAANLHFAEKRGSIHHEMRIQNLKMDARGI
jgi:hypothetical protein